MNGTRVTFDDVPSGKIKEITIDVPDYGLTKVIVIDTKKADKTTRHHGIAWRVNGRLVGNPRWLGFEQDRILDGRTNEAKRCIFIVRADFLADAEAVKPDWSGFHHFNPAWGATRDAVHDAIRGVLSEVTASRRKEAKESIKENLGNTIGKLAPVSRDKWNEFVDEVIDKCPTISTENAQRVAAILANLEVSSSKFGLTQRLHSLKPSDLDELNQILTDWSVRTAKIALDEIQSSLSLIEELDRTLRDEKADEVADLQPLFGRSLWVFGPAFESIEFTSNKGMTEVIRKIFGGTEQGSLQRPDFVVLPDGSAGFYSRDAYDSTYEVGGVARLIIAEIKRPGVAIGLEQKTQAWRYVSVLIERGFVTESTQVTCFVLCSRIRVAEVGQRVEWDGRVVIQPMAYDTFIKRASARMLGLREKLISAPFLKDQGIDAAAYITPYTPKQTTFDLSDPSH